MTVSRLDTTSGAGRPSLSVDDFSREASFGRDLRIEIHGESYKIVAAGSTPSGRSVEWIESSDDATRLFIEALADSYGVSLSRAIIDELGLRPTPGKPLSARTVTMALAMVETARDALDGVHFSEQLQLGEMSPRDPTAG